MGEIRIVSPGKKRGYPYPVCKKIPYYIKEDSLDTVPLFFALQLQISQCNGISKKIFWDQKIYFDRQFEMIFPL